MTYLLSLLLLLGQYTCAAGSNGCSMVSQYTQGVIGRLLTANMNVTTDQAITMPSTKYIIDAIVVTNPSVSLTTAVGGMYTGASKTGTTIVSNVQVYSLLTGATKFINLALASGVTGDSLSSTTIYFALTTGQGATATADVYVFGKVLP